MPDLATKRTASKVMQLPGLQAARGCAALAVLFFHAGKTLQLAKYGGVNPLASWTVSGALGVDFFFALSGFIILHAHAGDIGKAAALPRYAWRRVTRIYPVYWVYLTAVVFVLAVAGRSFGVAEIAHNYLLIGMPDNPIIYPAWSLFSEVFFYFAFATLIVNRRLGQAVFAAWLALTIARPAGWPREWFDPINWDFMAGMLACMAFRRLDARFFWWPLMAGSCGLAAITWLNHVHNAQDPKTYMATGLASALVICGLALADKAGAFRVPKPLLYLGAASYTIYLTQLAVLAVVGKAALLTGVPLTAPLAVFVVFVIATAALGCALHHIVETPILSRLQGRDPTRHEGRK